MAPPMSGPNNGTVKNPSQRVSSPGKKIVAKSRGPKSRAGLIAPLSEKNDKFAKNRARSLPAIYSVSQARHSGSHSDEQRSKSAWTHILRIDDSEDDGYQDPCSDDLVQEKRALD